jgi:hypothetical protein
MCGRPDHPAGPSRPCPIGGLMKLGIHVEPSDLEVGRWSSKDAQG